jgi:PAS domain S-box-containing protein
MPVLVSFSFLGVVMVMGYELSRDVLRAAQLLRDLQRSEQQLTLAAAAGKMSLWEWDFQTNRIWVNEAGRTLYGVRPDETIDFKRFAATIHAPDRPLMERAVEAALAGPDPYAADYRVDLPDGTLRWMAARGKVERDSKGRALRMRGISMDVTGRKEAELESARHRQELAHLSRVSILGELAGTLAHELNQPLAAILGNAQVGRRMMADPAPDLKELGAIFDDVADDAKRAGGIIHGMRAMFRKDPVTEPQPVDLNESVDQVLSLVHSEVVGRKAKVEFRPGSGLPPAAAGRVEVQQIILNLVLNGLDAMKGAAREGLLEITTSQEGDQLQLTVRDHGPGIPAELMPRLFEPFVTTKSGGLGLGLAISRGIAERFRGGLKAENHPEGGAEFRVTLPVALE